MAMGKRKPKQQGLFMAASEIVKTKSHPFYKKVSEIFSTGTRSIAGWSICASGFTHPPWAVPDWPRAPISACC